MYLHPPEAGVDPPLSWDPATGTTPPWGEVLGWEVGRGAESEGEEPWVAGLPTLNTGKRTHVWLCKCSVLYRPPEGATAQNTLIAFIRIRQSHLECTRQGGDVLTDDSASDWTSC